MKINKELIIKVAAWVLIPTVLVVGYYTYKHFTNNGATAEQKEKRSINFIRKKA